MKRNTSILSWKIWPMLPTSSRTPRGARGWIGLLATIGLGACALGDTSSVTQDLSPDPCTSIRMPEPADGFTGIPGIPITLTGVATCPADKIPEYQYWYKRYGAA